VTLCNLARHPTRAIRIALLSLLFALGLNSFAHANHVHDTDVSAAQHAAFCGYCSTFAGVIDAPGVSSLAATPPLVLLLATVFLGVAVHRRTSYSACPRGPPHR
jgi:hypothetical protein